MGLKTFDVAPVAVYGPTATTPYAKDVVTKVFAVNRTDTIASTKCVLPADATIMDIRVVSPVASNAGTTAVINVGTPASNTFFLTGVDVKTAAGVIRPTSQVSNILNLENTPLGADIAMTAYYAETGGASTLGGPFYVIVEYVR